VESERFVQRVRIVLLGAVFSRSPTNESPITGNVIERQLKAGNQAVPAETGNAALPQEPLAQLGVAPGNADQNSATPANGAPAGPSR
jgi:hypothetical protein